MNGLKIGDVGGNMTVHGDITAGNKIVRQLQEQGELTPEQSEQVEILLAQLDKERQLGKPDSSEVENLLGKIADVGVSTLIKIVTGLLL